MPKSFQTQIKELWRIRNNMMISDQTLWDFPMPFYKSHKAGETQGHVCPSKMEGILYLPPCPFTELAEKFINCVFISLQHTLFFL